MVLRSGDIPRIVLYYIFCVFSGDIPRNFRGHSPEFMLQYGPMETTPPRPIPGFLSSYLSRMVPRRQAPAVSASWQNNQPPSWDGMSALFSPENQWMIDEIRREFGNVPEEVLMDILRRKYQNGGPQMKNPQLTAPMPTQPRMGARLQPRGGTYDPHDPLGMELPMRGLRF